MSLADISKWTLSQLREQLTKRDISTIGKKSELIERLSKALDLEKKKEDEKIAAAKKEAEKKKKEAEDAEKAAKALENGEKSAEDEKVTEKDDEDDEKADDVEQEEQEEEDPETLQERSVQHVIKPTPAPSHICLLVLCGLPASGKTTFSTSFTDYLSSLPDKVVSHTVSYDDVITTIDVTVTGHWKSLRMRALATVREAVTALAEDSEKVTSVVIVDDNNFYSSMRYEFYKLSAELGASFAEVYISCPLATAVARNANRGNSVSLKTLTLMDSHFETPDPIARKWEKFSVTLCGGSEFDNSLVWKMICKSLKSPALVQHLDTENRKQSQKVTAESLHHQYDLFLRGLVNSRISSLCDKSSKSSLAPKLINVRKSIMADITHGKIRVDTQLSGHDKLADTRSSSLFVTLKDEFDQRINEL